MSGCLGLRGSLSVLPEQRLKHLGKRAATSFPRNVAQSSQLLREGGGLGGGGVGDAGSREREREAAALGGSMLAGARPAAGPAPSLPPPSHPFPALPLTSLSSCFPPTPSLPSSLPLPASRTPSPPAPECQSSVSVSFTPETTLGPGHKPISQMSKQGRGRGLAESNPPSAEAGSWTSCRTCGPQCKMKLQGSSFKDD